MIAARMFAEETTLYLAPDTAQSTEIAYAAERPVAIWYRHNFYVWIRLVLDRTGAPKRPNGIRQGSFRSAALRPGDVLEYRLYLDPAHNPARGEMNAAGKLVPHDGITLMGLKAAPTAGRWPRHATSTLRVGSSRHRIGSPGRTSHVLVEVAREKPLALPSSALAFATPEISLLSLNRQSHQLDLGALAPGADYHLIARHSDAQGNWFCDQDTLATPRRPVKTATFAGARWLSAVPSNG